MMDINPEKLRAPDKYAQRHLENEGAKPRITATGNLSKTLERAGYAINMVQVGGLEATREDFYIPAIYSLK